MSLLHMKIIKKKENKMTKTNLEQYKRELAKIFYQEYGNPAAIFGKIKTNCDSNIRSNYGETYMYDVLDWMSQPCKECTLSDTERKYLSAVIRPFKKDVCTVCKKYIQSCSGLSYEYLVVKLSNERWGFPKFVEGTMYKGMELDKEYSLEKLGL